MSATPARLAALRVLRHVRAGGLADAALRSEQSGLAPRDRAFTVELVRGTLRLRGRLDHILAAFTRRGLDRLDPDVLDVLRLGAYQLLEMDGVPPYAAVSQSVDLARPTGASALVNAVLRVVRREGGTVPFPRFAADPTGWLITWGSHPQWLVDRWIAKFGADATRRLVEMNNERPALYLRLIGQDVEDALAALARAGIAASGVDGQPGSIRLDAGAAVEAALSTVRATVQDPAASRVAMFADPGHGVLLDLCAAPGGKAVVIAAGGGTGHASRVRVVAADVSWPRMQRVIENVRRLGLPVGMVVADGRRPPFRPAGAVLVDAPCTGTGTLRRHADARWRVGPSDLDALVRLQTELLDAAADATVPGGTLVYATCSLEDEENDGQVDAFLARHAGFEVDRTRAECDDAAADIGADGRLRLLPHVHGFDGAFAVRLHRRR